MAGYSVLFPSLTTGTLCGKWPDVGLWPIVLSLADRHGVVDVTVGYLARVTGLAESDVAACIERFCEPDPGSRSQAHEGRRLLPLDPVRGWGWRVVNHSAYRERARKQAWDADRTESGRDAERKRAEREASRRVPKSPASPRSPDADSDADSEKNPDRAAARPGTDSDDRFAEIRKAYPKRSGSQRWPAAARRCLALVEQGHRWEELIASAHRYRAWCASTGKLGTEHVQQAATFYGEAAGFLDAWDSPPSIQTRGAVPAQRYQAPPTPADIERAHRDAAAANSATVTRALPNLRVDR